MNDFGLPLRDAISEHFLCIMHALLHPADNLSEARQLLGDFKQLLIERGYDKASHSFKVDTAWLESGLDTLEQVYLPAKDPSADHYVKALREYRQVLDQFCEDCLLMIPPELQSADIVGEDLTIL
ncbi:MAG: hypothetical protein WCO55_01290 [Candidatus Falkowbacteria bacterium]